MHSLPLFHRLTGQPVILLGEGEASAAKRRLLERAGAAVVGEDNAEARLAFIALADPDGAAQRLRARGLLINVADRPDLCDFTLPSILERGAVVVAVGTGGASAGLAKALRLRLESLLPQSLGQLAQALLAAGSAVRARWPDAAERRRALDQALGAGGPLDPLAEGAAASVATWLETGETMHSDCVEIALTSDDPDDLTFRHARLLGSADLLAYEPGVPEAILIRARADAVRQALIAGTSLARSPGLTVILRRG